MPPLSVGPFQLAAPVGRGGMGEVWAGEHTTTRVPVAIKLLRPDAVRFRDAFFAEVRAVARLDHPSIIYIFDHGVVTPAEAAQSGGKLWVGQPWMAMEFCSGGTLEGFFPVNWNGLRRILMDILDSLACAHARGLLHRDIKPDNVILSTAMDVRPGRKLTDFGLAFADEAEGNQILGTPAYMAPEQFHRQWRDYGPWTDLYALGCLGWTLATGSPPFGQNRPPAVLMLAHTELPPPAFAFRFAVPPGLEAWLRRLLEKEPAHRFACAADARAALSAVDGGPAVLQVPVDWRVPTPPRTLQLLGTGAGLQNLRPIPMVGRQGERDQLWSDLRTVFTEGGVRCVLLHGTGGIGKTRLGEWLAERAQEVGAAEVLRIENREELGEVAISQALARFFSVDGLMRPAMEARLQALLRGWGEENPIEARGLASLILPGDEGSLRFESPTERYALLGRHLERLSARRPVLLWLSDAQWGADSLACVEHLLRAELSLRLLIVISARDETLGERPLEEMLFNEILEDQRSRPVMVGPLSAMDMSLLVREHLGLTGTLAAEILQRAGGNPSFAVQLALDLLQRGDLLAGPEGFSLRPGAVVALPDDLYATWAARLAREVSDPRALTSLELAATLGDPVDVDEWRTGCMLAELPIPANLLDRLTQVRLIRRDDGRFRFVSSMLRETLLRAAAEAGRERDHHLICAEVLRRKPGGRHIAERLGRHLVVAGLPGEAVEALRIGALDRFRKGEHRAADALLRQREQVLAGLEEEQSHPQWGQGWLLHVQVLRGLGHYEAASQLAERLVDAAERNHWTELHPHALVVLAAITRARGRPSAAIQLFFQARDRFQALRDEAGVARCLLGLGEIANQMGELGQAMRMLQQALHLFIRLREPVEQADCLRGMADTARRAGELDLAEQFIVRALVIYQEQGRSSGEAASTNIRGAIARARGALDPAEQHALAALQIFTALGSRHVAFPMISLGTILVQMGRVGEARRHLERALRLVQQQGRRGLEGAARAALLATQVGDNAAFDQNLALTARLLEETDTSDPDIAEMFMLTARATEDPRRRQAVYELARAQWLALGRHARVAEVDVALLRG